MTAPLIALVVPKWGLAMEEGLVTAWHVAEGDPVTAGQEIVDIETTKIANSVESPAAARLARIVAPAQRTVPVGGLLGVLCTSDATAAQIDEFIASFAPSQDEDLATAKPEPNYIDAAGRRIRVLKTGPEHADLLPILLLHGFYADLDTWMFLRDRLPTDRLVIALDLPGHGGSAKDVARGDIAEFAAAVLGVMDHFEIPKGHLVGHSMGGAISLYIANQHANRVASVVALAAAGFGQPVNRAFVQGMLAAKRARDFRPPAEMLFADKTLVTRDLLEDLAKVKRIDGVQAALEKIAEASLYAASTADLAAATTAPVLAIFGEHDQVVPPAANVPQAVRSLYLPVGHMVHMEAPVEVAKAIGGFLEGRK